MHEKNNCTVALILMAGTGERFGSELPKQFHRLSGKKIYLHTLETFLASHLFEKIILVCPKDWIDQVRVDLNAYPAAPIELIVGGTTRQESSFKGLLACNPNTQIVVIHDAVRPFVSVDILKNNVKAAHQFGAVDTCIPSADTLVFAPDQKTIAQIPQRSNYFRGQTPQSFHYSVIFQAHKKALETGILGSSDDCSLVLAAGHAVHVVLGNEENMKITSELDLILAEQILRLKKKQSAFFTGDGSLKNKRFVVTGGTGGIGRALCEQLKSEGAHPIVLARSAAQYCADLRCYNSAKLTFDQILADQGPIDGLINCVGFLQVKKFQELLKEEIDQLINANLTSVIYSCKCAHLKEKAHIVNIASSSYTKGRKDFAIYASTKSAVVNFTQGLAEEREDLLINAVIPQRTRTAMRSRNFPAEDPETLLEPKDVAKEIIALLKQSDVTGTLLEVRKM